MTDDIRVGTNASLTVAEAARTDDGLILTESDADVDERANQPLAAFAQETDQ